MLTNGDPIGSWSGIVRSDGLRSGDVADAMAAYWVMNWVIANQGDNNRAQTLAVEKVELAMTTVRHEAHDRK